MAGPSDHYDLQAERWAWAFVAITLLVILLSAWSLGSHGEWLVAFLLGFVGIGLGVMQAGRWHYLPARREGRANQGYVGRSH